MSEYKIQPPFFLDEDDNHVVHIGYIIGVVTSLDTVESKFTGEDLAHHDALWITTKHYKKWRWNFNDGLSWFIAEHKPNKDQLQFVRDHLTKSYGIQWFENGFHDWEVLSKKRKELEENQQEREG